MANRPLRLDEYDFYYLAKSNEEMNALKQLIARAPVTFSDNLDRLFEGEFQESQHLVYFQDFDFVEDGFSESVDKVVEDKFGTGRKNPQFSLERAVQIEVDINKCIPRKIESARKSGYSLGEWLDVPFFQPQNLLLLPNKNQEVSIYYELGENTFVFYRDEGEATSLAFRFMGDGMFPVDTRYPS